MQVGSIVQSKSNFDDVRIIWNLPYPVMNQILTVETMIKHPKWYQRGIAFKFYLLTFEEMYTMPLCHRNFVELQPPMDLSFIEEIQKPTKILTDEYQ